MICKCIKKCGKRFEKGKLYEFTQQEAELYYVFDADFLFEEFDTKNFKKYFKEEN